MELVNNTANAVEVLRQPNQTLAVLPVSGRITATMRKLFATMLFFSQQDGSKDVYRRSFGELMNLAEYNSRNTLDLREQFRLLQSIQVEWNTQASDETRWGVSGMIAQAEIVEHKGHATYVEWSLPPRIRQELLDPTSYTALLLHMSTALRGGSSIALYEICSRYKTSPNGLTMRQHWEWFCPRITGNPGIEVTEYKYFKRDVLKRAMAEVNAMTDIEVTLIEHKMGRRVEQIQFKVSRKANPFVAWSDTSANGGTVDMDLLNNIVAFGIKPKQAKIWCEEYDEDFLRKTVALVRQRDAAVGLPKLGSVAAYFRTALRDRIAEQPEKAPAKPAALPQGALPKPPTAAEAAQVDRMRMADEAYRAMSIEDQEARRDQFIKATPIAAYAREVKRHGLGRSQVAKAAFCEWLADSLWGNADAAGATPPEGSTN
ncbi:replication initiation protein [Massilia aerilata]|uniref:Replication initiation protein n=1 Tax=Massilia aerilata TaxID=453817 RepID=A0ABW0S068_9BURK